MQLGAGRRDGQTQPAAGFALIEVVPGVVAVPAEGEKPAIAGVACASNTMQPSSPTITAEFGSPSAVNAYRSVPISEKVTFFSVRSVVEAKPLAMR